ncbi:hypothetical protein V039C_0009 [Vibrio phage V039C]|nr:hypothetical protein V039C_0009 [Vibrio phage V039C]
MEQYIFRMIDEEKELKKKTDALRHFIFENAVFKSLDQDEQLRMMRQLSGMEIYLTALSQRLMVASGEF